MFKKLASLSGAGLLALAGCGGKATTQTFVTDSATVPTDSNDPNNAAFTQDFNGDGVKDQNDNSLGQLNAQLKGLAAAGINIDLQTLITGAITSGKLLVGADVTAKSFTNDKNPTLLAYLAVLTDATATPKFDGSDTLTVSNNQQFTFNGPVIANSNLTTSQSDFVFALPLDPNNPTQIALHNAELTGTIGADNTISGGTLSGTIATSDFAVAMQDFDAAIQGLLVTPDATAFNNGGAPVACDGDNTGASATCDAIAAGGFCTDTSGDGTATGVCVDSASKTAQLFAPGGIASSLVPDSNKNGHFDVVFDAASGSFTTNELQALFNLVNGAPSGLLGGLFLLDLNGDGTKDAMGLGLGFTAVAAIHQQ